MNDYAGNAVNFEGVKVGLRHTKDGVILQIAIHPNDMPTSVFTDLIGARYMIAMVKLDDDDQPVVPQEKSEGQRMVQQCALMCRNPTFQKWLFDQGYVITPNEEEATEWVRHALQIKSRAELAHSRHAQEGWRQILAIFEKERK